jgi:hypothetical protein
MNRKITVIGAALATGVLASCGGSHDEIGQQSSPSTPSSPSTNQSLDTVQLLVLAKTSSETSSPFAVNNGAVTLIDTSDTTAAMAID